MFHLTTFVNIFFTNQFVFLSVQHNKGKIAVLGSVHIFSDPYVEKEENSKILDVIISFLTTDEIRLNQIDAEDPEVKSAPHVFLFNFSVVSFLSRVNFLQAQCL